MCCQSPHHPINHVCSGMSMLNCGCGCLGKENTQRNLENYREYLKQELDSVERMIPSDPDTDT